MPLRLFAKACTARSLPRHALAQRAYSIVTALPRCEQFDVPCRTNGSVRIDIFYASTPSAPILMYLPPGPVVPDSSEEEERVISTLRATSATTLVRINYRASAEHQYPTPYHDALFAYDWISKNMLHDEFHEPCLARLGVCGELIGGSIATMLALTECRSGESRISAAAPNNPIVDWVFPDILPPLVDPSELPEPVAPDETAFPADEDPADSESSEEESSMSSTHRTRKKRTPPTAWQLYGNNEVLPTSKLSIERNILFRRPEDSLDRFASPIHFFRSPHAQLIIPQSDNILASEQPDALLDIEAKMSIKHYESFSGKIKVKVPVELPFLSRCRAYTRYYPPAGMKLRLPVWNITAGSNNPLFDQVSELEKIMIRTIARNTLKSRTGRMRWLDPSEKLYYQTIAQGMVQSNWVPGIGLWTQQDHNPEWKSQVEEIGAWMKKSLE